LSKPISSRAVAIPLVSVFLTSCAAHSPPTQLLADTQAAVESASVAVAGAPSDELKRANRKLALARRWMAAHDHEPAAWLAEQAQVDAELAIARVDVEAARARRPTRVVTYPQ